MHVHVVNLIHDAISMHEFLYIYTLQCSLLYSPCRQSCIMSFYTMHVKAYMCVQAFSFEILFFVGSFYSGNVSMLYNYTSMTTHHNYTPLLYNIIMNCRQAMTL